MKRRTPAPRVFSWNIKGSLVPKSVEVILSDFEKRLAKVEEVNKRIDNLDGRIKVLESEFDEFKDMDVMWAQEMEVRIDGIRKELASGPDTVTDSDSDYDCDPDR